MQKDSRTPQTHIPSFSTAPFRNSSIQPQAVKLPFTNRLSMKALRSDSAASMTELMIQTAKQLIRRRLTLLITTPRQTPRQSAASLRRATQSLLTVSTIFKSRRLKKVKLKRRLPTTLKTPTSPSQRVELLAPPNQMPVNTCQATQSRSRKRSSTNSLLLKMQRLPRSHSTAIRTSPLNSTAPKLTVKQTQQASARKLLLKMRSTTQPTLRTATSPTRRRFRITNTSRLATAKALSRRSLIMHSKAASPSSSPVSTQF